MITVNSVYKYIDMDEANKIRIIDVIDEFVYIVILEQSTSMPQKEFLTTIQQEIEAKKLIKIKDPFLRVIDEKELSKLQIEKRDNDWLIIIKYWNENKKELLEKKSRGKVFEKIASEVE